MSLPVSLLSLSSSEQLQNRGNDYQTNTSLGRKDPFVILPASRWDLPASRWMMGKSTDQLPPDLPQLKSEIRKFDFPPRKFDSTWFVFDLFNVKSNLQGVCNFREVEGVAQFSDIILSLILL